MPPVLKESVEVAPAGAAVRLLDHASGRFLELTADEGSLLALYDGTASVAQLAAKAQQEGLKMDGEQVAAILERVRRAGFLAEAAAFVPLTAAPPLLLTDTVPLFRPDLRVDRQAGAKGLMEVFDPVRQRSFSLYDFEVSIARMLNGQRTAEEVVQAGARLGIAVTLDSLRKFIRQLHAYHFLAQAPEASPAGAKDDRQTWAPRQPWTPEVREFFQSALHLFRVGRMEEALGHLDALLQLDAGNADALELRGRVKEQLEGGAALAMLFDDLHGGVGEDGAMPLASGGVASLINASNGAVNAPPADGPAPPAASNSVSPAWMEDAPPPAQDDDLPLLDDDAVEPHEPHRPAASLPAPVTARPAPVAPAKVQDTSAAEEQAFFAGASSKPVAFQAERTPVPSPYVAPDAAMPGEDSLEQAAGDQGFTPAVARPRVRWWLAAAGLGAALLLLFPVPGVEHISCELTPMVVAEVTSVRAGRLVQWLAKDGATVQKGDALARLGTDALDEQLGALQQQRAAVEARLAVLRSQVAKASQRPEAALLKAEEGLARLLAREEQLDAAGGQTVRARAAVAKAQADQAAVQARLDAAKGASKAPQQDPAITALQKELEETVAARRRAESWLSRTSRNRAQLRSVAKELAKQRTLTEQARTAVAALARKPEVDALQAELDAIAQQALAPQRGLQQSTLTAPVDGVFRMHQSVGTEVGAGQAVGHIVEPLEIALALRGLVPDTLDFSHAALVLQGGQRLEVRFKSTQWTTSQDGKKELRLAVDNSDGTLGTNGLAVLEVPKGRRPLVAMLWDPGP